MSGIWGSIINNMTKILQKANDFINKGQKRSILAKKNIIYSFLIKIINIFVVLATVSISIKLLGAENYGIWIVLAGIITWSNLFNLGFSNGLKNKLAESLAKDDFSKGQYYVSTTYAFLIIISIVIFSIFSLIAYNINYYYILLYTIYFRTNNINSRSSSMAIDRTVDIFD